MIINNYLQKKAVQENFPNGFLTKPIFTGIL